MELWLICLSEVYAAEYLKVLLYFGHWIVWTHVKMSILSLMNIVCDAEVELCGTHVFEEFK